MSSGAAVAVTILYTGVCNKIKLILLLDAVFLLSYVCILFNLHICNSFYCHAGKCDSSDDGHIPWLVWSDRGSAQSQT